MDSRNPVFNRSEGFQRGGYATFEPPTPSATQLDDMYQAPSATSRMVDRMTLDDVVVRTAMLFAALVASAGATFVLLQPSFGIILGAGLVGMVLGIVIQMMKRPVPALMFVYAAIEGVFVGGISKVYESVYDGIIAQAVLGTLSAFVAMLALYKTGKVRNSPKFTKTLMIAGVGYMVFGLVHLLGAMFGWWTSIYAGGGLLAVVVSAFGVVLASLFLVLDFDFIEQGLRNGVPKTFAWTAAFGLIVTLVWLYLEVLRLIAILRGDD